MTPPPSPLPYFVKAAVIWQRYLQTSNSNNLIFAFFVFSLPLPPLLPTPLYVSMQPHKISQDIKSDIQCPPLKWPPFWPLPPSGPFTQNFSFHSTEIFDFRVAAKKQRKNTTYYHHHLLFLANPKQKTEKFLSNLKW